MTTLITDMSSVWVDYLLLDKPMIFAFPDIADYRNGRGLNIEPYEHWVPGPFVTDMDGLIDAIAAVIARHDPSGPERRLMRRRLHQWDDAKSTDRLLDGLGVNDLRGTPT